VLDNDNKNNTKREEQTDKLGRQTTLGQATTKRFMCHFTKVCADQFSLHLVGAACSPVRLFCLGQLCTVHCAQSTVSFCARISLFCAQILLPLRAAGAEQTGTEQRLHTSFTLARRCASCAPLGCAASFFLAP